MCFFPLWCEVESGEEDGKKKEEEEEEEESNETEKDKGGRRRCKYSEGEEAELTHKVDDASLPGRALPVSPQPPLCTAKRRQLTQRRSNWRRGFSAD